MARLQNRHAGRQSAQFRRPRFTDLHTSPPSTYAYATWIFLRLLGVVFLVAFGSIGLQVRGLYGANGIVPAAEFMAEARRWADAQQLGGGRFIALPTLCWFASSDWFLEALSAGGVLLSVLLTCGIAPAIVLPMLWLGYLSLSVVGGDFLSYQWDALLLETSLLAVFVAPLTLVERAGRPVDPPPVARWLLWWLLFRLIFGSGIVKLASGDPTWRGLTALTVHYETQPIPTPLAWYAHQLPAWFHRISTAAVLGIELAVPWLIFAPQRRARNAGCLVLVGLQGLIALTGNYAFFNLLTVAISVLLLDDATLSGALSRRIASGAPVVLPPRWPRWVPLTAAAITAPVSVLILGAQLGIGVPGAIAPLEALIAPFRSVNPYGLFAVMTTTRPEIVVEGSNDGVRWLPYEFKYKPGDPRRRPPWVAPYQPRLDWQMWFAALSRYEQEPWFQSFCQRLLEGSPPVLRLLARNPFPGQPPRLVRATLFRYRFADAATRRREGVWWVREEVGPYSPVLSRRDALLCEQPGSSRHCRGSVRIPLTAKGRNWIPWTIDDRS